MNREKIPARKNDEAELTILDLNSEGDGVGRVDGVVYFVRRAVPGDTIRARVSRLEKNRVEAELVSIIEPSPHRVSPPCPYQAECGGCPLMVLTPQAALDCKVSHLEQVLQRIGRLELSIERVVPSPGQLRYRGRVRFAAGPRTDRSSVGYHGRSDTGSFIPVERCLLIDDAAASLARELLDRLASRIPPDSVWPTHITMRSTSRSDRWLAAIHTPEGSMRGAGRALEELLDEQPRLAGAVRVLERSGRSLGEKLLAGSKTLTDEFCGLEIEVGATTFLQVNRQAADLLYRQVEELLEEGPPPQRLLDLYCGLGLLGLTVTKPGVELLGVESHRESALQAREIAARIGREDARFRATDCLYTLKQLVRDGEQFDRVVMNPPRSGAGKGAPGLVRRLGAQVVVLVSCHPAALARDLASFRQAGFAVDRLRAVDMFPQTAHLETVARLVRHN